MKLLSDDDLNLKDMTPEELDRAWDLWFDLAQATNDFDPPYTHGVLAGLPKVPESEQSEASEPPLTGSMNVGAGLGVVGTAPASEERE